MGPSKVTHQVSLDDLLMGFERCLLETAHRTYTCVVYPDVYSALAKLGSTGCQGLYLIALGHVGGHGHRIGTAIGAFVERFKQCLLISCRQYQTRAFAGKSMSCGAAYAAGRSGDDHHLAAQRAPDRRASQRWRLIGGCNGMVFRRRESLSDFNG
ncbi:hypothetical protein D3C76_1262780 [compost metagenome]